MAVRIYLLFLKSESYFFTLTFGLISCMNFLFFAFYNMILSFSRTLVIRLRDSIRFAFFVSVVDVATW